MALLTHVPPLLTHVPSQAGQTKFKTCALEYVRALALKPRVVASSNHLGNNDMRNLLSPKPLAAKLRVKATTRRTRPPPPPPTPLSSHLW